MQNTLAFGDSISNDSSMIERAGYGVAMKNSCPALQQLADDITLHDNDGNGLGLFLRNFYNPTATSR
jgi:hydroxymethylpyrimidine pyrophosphatase-like HAD family hydrolase